MLNWCPIPTSADVEIVVFRLCNQNPTLSQRKIWRQPDFHFQPKCNVCLTSCPTSTWRYIDVWCLLGRRYYYASSERVLNLWIKTLKKQQKQAIAYVSRCICRITLSSSIKQYINQNWFIWNWSGVDGSDWLHLCFDHRSESDRDVVFYKYMLFSDFVQNVFFFHETYLHFLFKSRGHVLCFDILHVQIFTQQNILGAIKRLWKW